MNMRWYILAETRFSAYTDEKLALCAKTQARAFSALLDRYLDGLRYRAKSFTATGAGDVDDYLSEGILGLLSAVRHYDPTKENKFSTFAYTCAQNRMLSLSKKLSPIMEHEVITDDISEKGHNPIAAMELMGVVNDVLERDLSTLERQVFCEYLSGEKYSSIAEKLGISEKSVDNALTRIRKKLRSKL